MPEFPEKLPVRTRLPLAAWAVAAVVALFSLVSSLLHAPAPFSHAMPSAEQGQPETTSSPQAKV
jgi:hypothetical protein